MDDALEWRAEDIRSTPASLLTLSPPSYEGKAQVGIDVVDDGEFGKSSWTGYLAERLGGFEASPVPAGGEVLRRTDFSDFAEFYADATRAQALWYMPDGRLRTPRAAVQWVCTGPVTYTGDAALQRAVDNLLGACKAADRYRASAPALAAARDGPARCRSGSGGGRDPALLGHKTQAMARRYAGKARDRQGVRLVVQFSPIG